MSTALTHLNPMRPYLNLAVRGGVFVRKIVVKDGKAVGAQAESGGKVFHVEADRVVLSAGAIRSPRLLMLSGIGPEDQLQQFGIPTIRHLLGVGQNLCNHVSAQVTFKVKDGISLAAHRDAVHFSLHYTAPGSSAVNDMVLRTTPVIDEWQEHVPGVRTRYLTVMFPRASGTDLVHAGVAGRLRICTVGLGRSQCPAVLSLLLSPASKCHSPGARRRANGSEISFLRSKTAISHQGRTQAILMLELHQLFEKKVLDLPQSREHRNNLLEIFPPYRLCACHQERRANQYHLS